MDESKFVFGEHIMALEFHEEEVIFIRGKAFIVRPASATDIERLAKGHFCMD